MAQAVSPELSEAIKLSRSAFQAEWNGEFEEALKLHGSAINALEKATHDGKVLTTEPVRLAKMQLKAHQAHREMLQGAVARKVPPAFLLPSFFSAGAEMMEFVDSNKRYLTIDEKFIQHWRNTATQPPQPRQPPEGFKHLLQNPVAPFTPTLDPTLPEKVYYVDKSSDYTMVNKGRWVKYKAKESPGGQDLYIMQTLTHKGLQNTAGAMYRCSDLFVPIIKIQIDPVPGRPDAMMAAFTGRNIHFQTKDGVRTERPDRIGKIGWTPRRFTYGGRKFVWKQEGMSTNSMKESLFEVEKEWPKPGSKTGKIEDKTVARKLMWSERPSLLNKYYILHFAGGLDQFFMEYLLASQLARQVAEWQTS